MRRGDRDRLLDIQDAIAGVEKHTRAGRAVFERDEPIQNLVLRHIQIIGEAARWISSDLRERHPELEWQEIIAMRNLLVHRYFGIDKEIVWKVVEQDLPRLKKRVAAILEELDAEAGAV